MIPVKAMPRLITVVLQGGTPIDLDVKEGATVADIRSAAAAVVHHPVRALMIDKVVLADDVQLLPDQAVVHQLQSRDWFLWRKVARAGYTPFHYAASRKHDACLYLLLQRHPEGVLATIPSGQTPFHIAAFTDSDACLGLLLQRYPQGATVKEQGGWTPLHGAAICGSRKCLDMLMQCRPQGVLVEGDAQGLTPFHLAAVLNRTVCLSLMLQHCPQGAALKDNNGRTPLDMASCACAALLRETVEAAGSMAS